MENKQIDNIKERELNPVNGWIMIAILLVLVASSITSIIFGVGNEDNVLLACGAIVLILSVILALGLRIIRPNEAAVLLLFGKYYGSIKHAGFYWTIPFCTNFDPTNKAELLLSDLSDDKSKATSSATKGVRNNKISLKALTLNNGKQKVNDADGNPIEIGVIVIWKIVDTAKAAFQVDNYNEFISIQADAAIRNIARQYPYDIADEDSHEKSLRGSSQEIANMLCTDLQERVNVAGIEIIEARISHLAYSQEIAAAMLQRQQAKAIVDARTTIVEGAVGMVELALEKLNESGCVELDNNKKAQMVSNLMVVLCANKDTQPVVSSDVE